MLSIPSTAFTTLLGFIVAIALWVYLGTRMNRANSLVGPTLAYLRNFFLYMSLFSLLMALPYLWLRAGGQTFSLAMAWGYVIGHVFSYIACIQLSLLVCTVIPQLNNKIGAVKVFWAAYATLLSLVNLKTMVWGVQPKYVAAHGLTEFNAAPIVGAGIGLMGLACFMPVIVLFLMAAVKSKGARRYKTALIALGFLLVTIGGPMHDVARNTGTYLAADIIYSIAMIAVGIGIAYRMETKLVASSDDSPAKVASSNTV